MGRTSQSDQLAEMIKSQGEAYLAVYRSAYEAGWQAAMAQALKIIEGKQPAKLGPMP
jgi:hypothetical protein